MIVKSLKKEIKEETSLGSLPDIDSDFGGQQRPRIKEYMEQRFGKSQVVSLGTYGTMQLKAAITDLARCENIPISIVRRFTAKLRDEEGMESSEDFFRVICKDKELREFVKSHTELFNDMMVILNMPKTSSIHACGMVVLPDEKTSGQWIPIKEQKGLIVTQWEGSEIEEAGFLKEDILGIEQLDKLTDILKLIKENQGIDIDLYKDIPLDDSIVFEYIKNGFLSDVFHFGAKGLSSYCVQMQPNSLDEMGLCAALYRPGPIENNYHNEYILRKRGDSEIIYPIGAEDILKPHLGLLITQEDIMRLCQHLAGFDLEITDSVRKAMGKKIMSKLQAFGDKFIQGYVEKFKDQGVTEEYAKDLWRQMEEFGKYAFNFSHAISYARNGYNCIWLKAHYPIEFWSVTFSYAESKDYPFYVNEIQRSGEIELKTVDINNSDINIVSDPKIGSMYWALNSVKQCGEKAQEFIHNERFTNGEFFSLDEFIDRCVVKNSPVNKSVIENLIYSGAFDQLESINAPHERLKLIESYRENKKVKILEDKDLLTSIIKARKEKNDWWWTLQQKKVSGLAFFDYENLVTKYHTSELDEDADFYDIGQVKYWTGTTKYLLCSIGGYVVDIVERKSRKGLFATITLESNYEFINVYVFPELFSDYAEVLRESKGNILLLNGYIQWDKFRKEYVLQTTTNSFFTVLS